MKTKKKTMCEICSKSTPASEKIIYPQEQTHLFSQQ